MCILLTPIFQRKEFKHYFLKKNLANYQTIAQIFSRDPILIVIWPSATFRNRKYCVLNDFCYAEFLAYYTLENKLNKTCDELNQPDELDDNLTENNHEECSYLKNIKLMISGETIRCRKVRWILRVK